MEKKSYFAAMVDCSRNGVLSVSSLKRFIDVISSFGYNALMIYTEDTYEIEGEPYFGYCRGRYTKEELQEVDRYGLSKGVELIPCIQTLAHLENIFRWGVYEDIHDNKGILLAEEEKTYEFIRKMIATCRECFTSKLIHIGMDEAMTLGLGKYLKLHGYVSKLEIMKRHLPRVTAICEEYGFTPMMWSDMFYHNSDKKMTVEDAKTIPSDLKMIYWDYYRNKVSDYEKIIIERKALPNEIWFAGGAWTWSGFSPFNRMSIKRTKAALTACKKQGVNNIIMTLWGDDGRECSVFSVLPTLFYAKKFFDGETNLATIKKQFNEVTGESFDAFLAMDLLNDLGGPNDQPYNVEKWALYNDPLIRILDNHVVPEKKKALRLAYRRLSKAAKESPNYGYIFSSQADLAKLLLVKYDLGVRTLAAYRQGKEELKALLPEYDKAIRLTKKFYLSFRRYWYTDYKLNGMEVQDIRLGGLMTRLWDIKEILSSYIAGERDSIDELEHEVLDFAGEKDADGKPINHNSWADALSANVLRMMI